MALSHFIVSTINRSQKCTVAELNNMAVILPDGVTLTRAATTHNPTGLPIPNPAPSAVVAGATGSLSGTYLYTVSYVDSTTGTYGAPSSTVEVSPTSNQVSLVFSSLTNTTSNSRVNAIDIHRTLANGNVLFWAARVAHTATNWVDSLSDARISANDTLKVANQAYRQLPQNTYGFVIENQGRLFAMGNVSYVGERTNVGIGTASISRWQGTASVQPGTFTNNLNVVNSPTFAALANNAVTGFAANRAIGIKGGTTVYLGKGNQARWCEKNNPDAWPTNNIVDIGGPEPIRSALSMGNGIYVFKDNQIFSWIYRDDPDKNTGRGSIEDMKVNRGAVTFKSGVNVDGSGFILDKKGIYQYRGGQSVFELGEPIKPIFDRINWDEVAQISGAYDERRIYWFVPLDGDTECRHALVLDRLAFESGRGVRWWLYYIPAGVRDASSGFIGEDADSVNGGLAHKRVAAIITTQGHEFFFADVYRDGVHPELTAVGTTSTATSTIFGTASGSFKVGDNDVIGCPVVFKNDRFPGEYIVTSATSTTFAIAGGSLGSTVPAGTSFVIGGIASYWNSRRFAVDGPHDKKIPYGLDIEFVPLAKNAQARAWVSGDGLAPILNANSNDQTGWAVRKYEDYALVDLGGKLTSHARSGFVESPAHAYGYDYLQIHVGHSGIDTPYFFTGFGITERSKRTNR